MHNLNERTKLILRYPFGSRATFVALALAVLGLAAFFAEGLAVGVLGLVAFLSLVADLGLAAVFAFGFLAPGVAACKGRKSLVRG